MARMRDSQPLGTHTGTYVFVSVCGYMCKARQIWLTLHGWLRHIKMGTVNVE